MLLYAGQPPRAPRPPSRGVLGRVPARAVAGGAALAAVTALAALAGWVSGGLTTGEDPAPAPPGRTAALGPASVVVPGGWRPLGRADAGPGRDPARTAAFEPVPGISVHATVALDPVASHDLVPAAVAVQLTSAVPRARRTVLAGRPAWHYADLSTSRRGEALYLTVQPTTAGVLSVTCAAPRVLWDVAHDCAAAVRRIDVRGARVLAPSADLALQLRLREELPVLDAERVRGRAALRAAGTRRGQARAASRLGALHRRAARRLAPRAADSGASADVVRALSGAGVAYGRLARAAGSGRPRGYEAARRAVRRADADLARAIARPNRSLR